MTDRRTGDSIERSTYAGWLSRAKKSCQRAVAWLLFTV